MAKGSDAGMSVLNERGVMAIRRMLADNISHERLSYYFGVTKSSISNININKTWKHVRVIKKK